MPVFANTPESKLGRTDSLNPETTCRGITSGGRPCRRPLTSTPGATPPPRPKANNRLRVVDDDPSDESLYCWQHKDQAHSSAHSSPGPRRPSQPGGANRPILESRESMDTLIDRLGIVEAKQKHGKNQNNSNGGGGGVVQQQQQQHEQQYSEKPPMKMKKRSIFCCCFSIPVFEEDEEDNVQEARPQTLPHRPKPQPVQSAPPALLAKPTSSSGPRPGTSASGRPSSKQQGSAYSDQGTSQNLLALIPPTTSPQTASQLLAELAKPPSANDEAGYIYIFWLTPENAGAKPPTDAARSLLTGGRDADRALPPSSSGSGASHLRPGDAARRQRRPSDVLASYAADRETKTRATAASQQKNSSKAGKAGNTKTILLKIGRANNVQRRLNEWTRQCGYDLDLVRYYPYVSNSAAAGSSGSRPPSSRATSSHSNKTTEDQEVRKTPHSHKVERLVHIELTGLGMRALGDSACEACGRQHREWFEVEAHRDGIAQIDEIIRRWCDWDEGRL